MLLSHLPHRAAERRQEPDGSGSKYRCLLRSPASVSGLALAHVSGAGSALAPPGKVLGLGVKWEDGMRVFAHSSDNVLG